MEKKQVWPNIVKMGTLLTSIFDELGKRVGSAGATTTEPYLIPTALFNEHQTVSRQVHFLYMCSKLSQEFILLGEQPPGGGEPTIDQTQVVNPEDGSTYTLGFYQWVSETVTQEKLFANANKFAVGQKPPAPAPMPNLMIFITRGTPTRQTPTVFIFIQKK